MLGAVTGQVCRCLLGWECSSVSVLHHPLCALAVGWQVEHLMCLNPVAFLPRQVVCLYVWPLENVVISCVLSLLEGSSYTQLSVGEGRRITSASGIPCAWESSSWIQAALGWAALPCWNAGLGLKNARKTNKALPPCYTHFPSEWIPGTAREKLILFCFGDLISFRPFPKVKSRSVVKLLCCIRCLKLAISQSGLWLF